MNATLALVPVVAALACAAVILTLLGRPNWLPLDRPNERSLHAAPIPRVGGLGIIAGILLAYGLLGAELLVAVLVALLASVSFVDDRSHLPIAARFAAHTLAAVVFTGVVLGDLPLIWQVVAVVALLWMTNLYNFMDGSDGLAGGMALFGFGAYALAAWIAGDAVFTVIAASVAGAALAFLAFNFPPARVFMGDAGSIPLGFLAAALGLQGWRAGHWPLWFSVLVFSPFIVDASVTLARRVLRGERFWEAHRSHYYQRLVQLGWGHRSTALGEYALMGICGTAGLWALDKSAEVQAAVLAGVLALYAALALAIDHAWKLFSTRAAE